MESKNSKKEFTMEETFSDPENINNLTEILLKLIDEKLNEYKEDDRIDLNEEMSIKIFKKSINNQISNIDSLRILKEKEVLQLFALVGALQNRKLILAQNAHIESIEQQISELKREKKILEEKVIDLQNTLNGKVEIKTDSLDRFEAIKLNYKHLVIDFGIEKFLKELLSKIKTNSELYNDLIVLKFRNNQITRDMRNGIISRIEFQREESVLATTCVNLIDTLSDEDLLNFEDVG